MTKNYNYSIYFKFIQAYLPAAFTQIEIDDPFIIEMEKKLQQYKQFFFIGDLLKIKINFTSQQSLEIIGVPQDKVDPSTFYLATHPDDLERHSISRAQLIKSGHDLYNNGKGFKILSTHLKTYKSSGELIDLLYQDYLFYTEKPYKTVFILQVMTDITSFIKRKFGYHYYFGDDLTYFRYPDSGLLKTGNTLSEREIEIIKYLAAGYDSNKIADKLFLSIHTINTHRRNMLKKTGKASTYELILDLKERGVI